MSDRLNMVLSGWLQGDETLRLMVNRPETLQWILDADELEITGVLRFLESVGPDTSDPQRHFLDRVLNLLAIRLRELDDLDAEQLERIAATYRRWGAEHRQGHLLLALLTSLGSPESLQIFAQLVVEQPPRNSSSAAVAFVPLLRQSSIAAEALFPQLLEALSHLTVASLVLDLANHVTRAGMVETHPAADRLSALGELFSGLVARLEKFESQPPTDPKEFTAARLQVTEATSIALAICDAMALIGDPKAVPKLRPALELSHRKIRLEAALALAKLGEDEGKQAAVALAAEPVCRPRILAMAEELGLTEKIPAVYQTEQAKVEGELAAWLAIETQFGLPPHEVERIDHRTLRWPGFEEPVDCHLIRYAYHMPGGSFQSVGVVGPVTQSFAVDLTHLSLPDIYAAFAGWQAEHPEVFEVEPAQWQPNQAQLAANLQQRLQSEGYEMVEPAKLGFFFGDVRLVAAAKRNGVAGAVVADLRRSTFYPAGESRHPIGPGEAYFIHVGREFLNAFNQDREDWQKLGEASADEDSAAS